MSYVPLRVVGLDLSLTSSGMSDGTTHRAVQTQPDQPLEARLERVLCEVRSFVLGRTSASDLEASLVVIEGGAYSRGTQSAAAEHLSGLRLLVRHMLWSEAVPFAMVAPTCLKAYTAGTGTAAKARMVKAVKDRHGIDLADVKVKDGRYDMADAAALAAMGYAWIKQPLPTAGPPAPMASLLAVKWPDEATSLRHFAPTA